MKRTVVRGHPWLKGWWRWGACVVLQDRAGEQYTIGDCTDEYLQSVIVLLARAGGADVEQVGGQISFSRPPLWRRLLRAFRGA